MYKILAVAPFLLLGAQAKPCLTCTPDSCLLVARQTGVPGLNAKSDCSAFMRTTVTPSTSYFTASATAIQTFDVTDVFTTSTFDTATQTDTTSVTTSETSFATISSVLATQTDNFAVTITKTETSTSTSTKTNTLFTTITGVPVPDKRSVPLQVKDLMRPQFAGVRRMVTPVGSIPAYATEACKDEKSYSSACRCAGVKVTTITAPVPSATVTVTGSASVTQTSQSSMTLSLTTTATQTQTKVITEVITQTVTVPLTSTISQTSTSTATETTTTGVTETTATTATSILAPAPTAGLLRVKGSQFDGQYLHVNGVANQENRNVGFGARSVANPLTIDASGHLAITGESGLGNTDPMVRAVFYFNSVEVIADSGFAYLTCKAAAGTNVVSCTHFGGGPAFFTTCNDNANTVVISNQVDAGCTQFEYVIEKA